MSDGGLFLGEFEDRYDLMREFEITEEDLAGKRILWGWYLQDNYDGHAWVVFEEGGELFDVHASHCSCNGLGEGWEPEPVTPEGLAHHIVTAYDSEIPWNYLPRICQQLDTMQRAVMAVWIDREMERLPCEKGRPRHEIRIQQARMDRMENLQSVLMGVGP